MRKSTLREITDVITKIAPSYPVISIDLFGSYADHLENEESDIDLLLLIDGPVDFQLKQNIWQSLYPIELEEDIVISLFVESKQTWETKYATLSLLFSNIEQEGIHV